MHNSVRLYQRKNGFWYIEFKRGLSRSVKTKDEALARSTFKETEKALIEGRLIALDKGSRTTISDFKIEFFRRHTDIAKDTVEAYDLAFKLLIESLGGSTMLSRINEEKIDKFKSDCLARGVAKISINTYLRHVRGIFNKAHAWGDIKKKLPIQFFKLPKRYPRILTEDEVSLLLLHSRHCNFEMYRVIKFALWTGARRSEIRSFTWQSVKGDMARLIGKGDKERVIPLLPGALEAMGPRRDIGPVFAQYHLDTYTHKFKMLARDCEIEDISPHKMRHTAATYMLAAGMDIVHVQEMLGHEDISTTKIYAQVLQAGLKKEAQKFNNFLKVE